MFVEQMQASLLCVLMSNPTADRLACPVCVCACAEAAEALVTLPGIGPKVAACICLFSLDKHEAIPGGRVGRCL